MEKHTDYAKIEKQARIRSRVRSTVSAYTAVSLGRHSAVSFLLDGADLRKELQRV